MPVLKINKNGEWQDIASAYTHSHTISDITDLPANLAEDIEALKDKVGAESVAYQVSTAIESAVGYEHPETHPADMITGLSTVATSGSYNDLTDLPEVGDVLPEIAEGDEGKVLGVVENTWQKMDLPKELPVITTEHNGKLLGVVDDAWAIVDAPKNENNYSDKKVVLAETDLEFTSGEHINFEPSFTLVEGEIYTVVWEGTEYPNLTAEIMSVSGHDAIGIGNKAIFEIGDDTSEPFAMGILTGGMFACYTTVAETATYSVAIYKDKPELPDITSEDNGKVLGVVDGKWQKMDVEVSSDGNNGGSVVAMEQTAISDADNGENVFRFTLSDETTADFVVKNGSKGSTGENGLSAYEIAKNHGFEGTEAEWLESLKGEDGKDGADGVGNNSGSSVQPDYAQNDETAADYIKNRPFYETTIRTEIMPESTLTFTNNATWDAYAFDTTPTTEQLEVWQSDWNKVTVVWNGTSYICEPQDYHGIKVVGNLLAYKGTGDNEMPFVFGVGGADIFGENYVVVLSVYDTQENNHEVAVFMSEEIITKIDSKYLPETNTLPEVTIDDNGKTLVVSAEGKWTVGESTGGSGECNLPEVDEGSKVSILPETKLEGFYYIEDYQMYGCNDSSTTINLSADDSCTVVWDGEKHTCTVVDMSSIMSGALGLGNLSFVGIENNNEPFAIGFFVDGGVTFLSTIDEVEGNSHTVEIYRGTPSADEGKTLQVVDGEWQMKLPDSCLPSVTTADNDKFLQVVNGKWTAVTIELAEGGDF